jgi:UDP-glucose 4-epimerase
MELLITGGCGFIGGHLSESFVAGGHDVTVLDSFDDFYASEIKHRNSSLARTAAERGNGRYNLIEGDICNADVVADAFDGIDIVFHQAAKAGVRRSVEEPEAVNAVNVTGTLNCLQAARDADVDRFVLASSSSVYGKPEYLPYDEEHPTLPISPYGASKVAAEHYTRVYHEVHDLSTVILRYFTVYGPRMRPNMAISNFVSRCMRGDPPVVYGDGSQTRDFTYIDDVVAANRTLLTTGAADGEILNIGSGDNIDIRSLAALVRDRINPDLELSFAQRYDADAEHTHANIKKARKCIGYDPSTDISDGVEKFISWYRQNREWYEPLIRS